MAVRADLAGEPAEGFRVAEVVIEPPQVRVTGARRQVLRLSEAVTEAVDVTGLDAPVEREVGLNLGGQNVWVDEPTNVRVRVRIEAEETPEENDQG
jgi:YbbR domain-containing protein